MTERTTITVSELSRRWRVARKTIIIGLLIAAPSVATAEPEDWTQLDTALEVATLATLGADMLQTAEICNGNPELETNPIACRVPRPLYFGAIAAAHVVVARALPQPYRAILQSATIAVELRCIGINWGAGYALHF